MDDPDDIGRFPHLYSALMGLPPWAMHLRAVNKFMVLLALGLAVYFWISEDWKVSGSYLLAFFCGYLVLGLIGNIIARAGPLLFSIILATVLLVSYQVFLMLHFFRLWSPFHV